MPIELDMSNTSGARLRVIGVGGAGGNAVRTMITRGLDHVDYIAANTDNQALMKNPAQVKIRLGSETTRGLGAGANPIVGRAAVEESLDEIREALSGADMVFVTAGMGGGTGTGAAPVIAREARELGALVVGIVTKPFSFENQKRTVIAEEGIKELRQHVDALIVIPNDRILSIADETMSYRESLERVDEVLYNATKGIADIILHEGIINVDFADVVTVMRSQGDAMMGIGVGSGPNRALEAAQNALNSPILEGMQILGAKGLLVNITGSSSLTMHEVHTAISCIQKAAGADANLIHGVVESEAMGEDISITVVATGFSQPLTSTTNTQEDSNEAFRNTTAHHVVNVNRSPQIQSSRTEDRQSDQTVVPQQIAAQPGSVDQNDIEVPAYWRRQGNSRHTEHVVQQNHVPARANTQQIPTPTPQATMASTPLPASPKLQSNQQTDSLTSQPEAFPRPRAKSASAGGGSKDPAFLRRIMD